LYPQLITNQKTFLKTCCASERNHGGMPGSVDKGEKCYTEMFLVPWEENTANP